MRTARMDTAETPKGGRGRLPRPAVVVLPDVAGSRQLGGH